MAARFYASAAASLARFLPEAREGFSAGRQRFRSTVEKLAGLRGIGLLVSVIAVSNEVIGAGTRGQRPHQIRKADAHHRTADSLA